MFGDQRHWLWLYLQATLVAQRTKQFSYLHLATTDFQPRLHITARGEGQMGREEHEGRRYSKTLSLPLAPANMGDMSSSLLSILVLWGDMSLRLEALVCKK